MYVDDHYVLEVDAEHPMFTPYLQPHELLYVPSTLAQLHAQGELDPHHHEQTSLPSTINQDELRMRDENEVEMDCVSFYEDDSIDAAAPTSADVVAELARSTTSCQQIFGDATHPIMLWLGDEQVWADRSAMQDLDAMAN